MIFKKLKQKSLRKGLDAQLKKRDASGLNAQVKTIGFLVNEAHFQDFEKCYDIFKDLSLQPKDVKVFSYIESKKKLPSLRQNQVQNKDFDWKGNLHNQNAQEFLDRDFDVLVGYYPKKHEILDLLVASSNAKFKVGFYGGDERLFDLLLDVPFQDFSVFKKELKKYLQVLGKIATST
ncbi:DUF6913 domain-containing protein [Marinirhabdus gelatinilytica]|uniref:Uncharacterized protein n=1 Tax=Marinirhabdus gelatinilytica TaxID=1703343 RepID=A0A370QF09_9FLAO|nr:hypothetical protein [Marinirhabdus gelatinilytica]RDK86859.1 hypothetical protein C8D94_10235 [Marinirhabdus gelatinilytica]